MIWPDRSLVARIDGTRRTLAHVGDDPVEPWDWLARQPGEERVRAAGPVPGDHIPPLELGGHTGRPCTIIIASTSAGSPCRTSF